MRHPALIALLLTLAASPAFAASAKKWTDGRSVCDSTSRQLLDGAVASPVEHKSLEQAWGYALADADVLAGLQCFPQAASSAAAFAVNLRAVQTGVMPGLEATTCGGAPAPERLARVKDSLARMRASEQFFSATLDKYDSVGSDIRATNPEGIAFDDCRAKAQRSWASARLSLNKLSCELAATLEQLDSFRERAEVAGLACGAPALVAQRAAPEAEPVRAPASEINPVTSAQYPAFTGVLVTPAASSAEEPKN